MKPDDRTANWFAPRNSHEAWFFAERFAKTSLVPKALRGRPDDVFLVITHGAHLGMHPAEAVAKLHVVEGKLQMDATEIRARVQRHEDFLWSPDRSTRGIFELTENCTSAVAELQVKKWWWEKVLTFRITIEEAKEARWGMGNDDDGRPANDWKPGSAWRKTPGDMLVARITGRYARRYCASYMSAVYTPEEMIDILFGSADADAVELKPVQPVVQQQGEGKAAAFARARRADDAVNGDRGAEIDAEVEGALEAAAEVEPETEPTDGPETITQENLSELAALCRRVRGKDARHLLWEWLLTFAREGGCDDLQNLPAAEFGNVKEALLKQLEDRGVPRD